MIRINLATRKQAVGAMGESKKGSSTKLDFNMDSLRELPIRKALVPIVAAIVATFVMDSMKQEDLLKWDKQISIVESENSRLQAEVAKTRGYEAIKKQLESDEYALQAKIDLIQKLIEGRQVPPQMMLALSRAIPADVWLSSFRVSETEVGLAGGSAGYNLVSDFIQNLNGTAFFSDVGFKSTRQERDATGPQLTTFELQAKRR